MAPSDRISVTGALRMSVDEFESVPSNIERVNELEMVCVSDTEHADETTVIHNPLLDETADFKRELSDDCAKGFVLETGPCYEVETEQVGDKELEQCTVGLNVQGVVGKKCRLIKDTMVSACENNGSEKAVATFACDVCAEQFGNISELKHHVKTHAIVQQHSCCYCSKIFQYRSHLLLHAKRHTDNAVTDAQLTCYICKRQFRSSSGLQKHRRVHDDIQRHKCSVCSKTFAFASVLAEHERIHSPACPFLCDVCGVGFKHTSNMLKHRRLMHELPGTSSSCQRCGPDGRCVCPAEAKNFSRPSSSCQFQCPICSKCFTNKSYKEMHLRVHTGERPYQCQICQFSFKQQSNLSKHMSTAHSTRRPFSCGFCSRTFAAKSNLSDHEKVHTDDRRFSCLLCSKRFITAAALRAHVSRHDSCKTSSPLRSQSQNNSDSVASASLTHISRVEEFPSLVALPHSSAHSSDKSFACKTCGKCFKCASNLSAHRCLHQRNKVDVVTLQTAPTDWITCEISMPPLSDPCRNSTVLPVSNADVFYQ